MAEEVKNMATEKQEAPVEDRETMHVSQKETQDTPREDIKVEQKRNNITAEQLKEGAYRGTLTPEQMEQYKKNEEKKVGELENTNAGDPKRYNPEKGKGEEIKEMDIIDFLYTKCFLKGVSWGFDQIEGGVEGFLLRLSEGVQSRGKESAVATAKAATKAAEEFLAKAATLGNFAIYEAGQYEGACERKKQNYRDIIGELNVDYNTLVPEKETELKGKYGESFINRLKEDYARDPQKVKKFFEACPQELDGAFDTLKTVHKLSLVQTHVEMQSEAMIDQDKWIDKTTRAYKTDDELKAELKARAQKHQHEILTAISTVSEDTRLRTEAEFSRLSAEEKREYVKERVLDVYDRKIETEASKEAKEGLAAQKAQFEKEFKENCPFDKITREAEAVVFKTISSFKVNDYLKEQLLLTEDAQKLQNEEILAGHYQANAQKPNKNIKKTIESFLERTDEVIEQGLNDNRLFAEENLGEKVIARRNLYEEGLVEEKATTQKVLMAMQTIQENETAMLAQRRENHEDRLARFQEYLEKMNLNRGNKGAVFAFATAQKHEGR